MNLPTREEIAARRARLGFAPVRPPAPAPVANTDRDDLTRAIKAMLSQYRKRLDVPSAGDNEESRNRWWVNKIIADVCVEYNVSRYDLTSSRRTKDISNARQDAAWRMRRDTTLSLPQIGRRLGNRDHGTIIHALRAHEARMAGGKYVKTRGVK